jgi:hypothetical protein
VIDLDTIRRVRQDALFVHRDWKASIRLADGVASDKWEVIWPDGVAEGSEPLVENLYSQALEDKLASAGATMPNLYVPAARGTRKDAAEKNAALRRRVFTAYWEHSRLRRDLKQWYGDWFHAGAVYPLAWIPWKRADGSATLPAERHPYIMRLDPRTVFPLGHNAQGDLTSALVLRQRRVADIQADWPNHPAINRILATRKIKGMGDPRFLEEIWYFDTKEWGLAIGDSMLPPQAQGYEWTSGDMGGPGGMLTEWLVEPHDHYLFGCPLVEIKRTTHDGSYRGALVDIIPSLKTAQNFMARLLDDLNSNIYAPVVLDNVENPEDYGPGAILVGTGNGAARVEHSRPPVNFEARQAVNDILTMARNQAFEPEQRAGSAGASIVSAKGTMALMGSFNAELAWAQGDVEEGLGQVTSITACLDEKWCYGTKPLRVFDRQGEGWVDTEYDPAATFKGDYRVFVTYGDRTGLDEQSHMTRLGLVRQLGGISLRTFMERAGISEDPLQEERDIAIEKLTHLFLDEVLPQQIQAGDLVALKKFIDRIDSDDATVRGAVLDTIREMESAAAADAQRQADATAAGPGGNVMEMMRSMAFGGIPGRAEGLPMPGADLSAVLPPQAQSLVAESAPGGNALPPL